MHLGGDFWPRGFKLQEEDRDNLIKPFEIEEVKGVIMEMKQNSAPVPNRFAVAFLNIYGKFSREM